MIKKTILLFIVTLLVVGCTTSKKTKLDELNNINDIITKYFLNSEVDNRNYSYNYVDIEKEVIVVGLINNSKAEQERFKKNVVDSKYIRFEKGERQRNH